jgi:hypothetical protein
VVAWTGQGAAGGGYVIEDRPEGRTLVVTGDWSDRAAGVLVSGQADGLVLNYARGPVLPHHHSNGHARRWANLPPKLPPQERGLRFCIRILPLIRAPLRNRTVDLLLTMNDHTIPLSLAGRLTWQNTSTGQRPQASDGPSRALLATQSATRFDLPEGRMAADAGAAGQAVSWRL